MPRLLFEKKGNAVWISHLDLMRMFQRSFKRAGLKLTHTQGFNPRPSVSIALPLSVGIESSCELLDFNLDGDTVSHEEIKERLNSALVQGVKVLMVYNEGQKIKNLSLMDCALNLEYDRGVPTEAAGAIRELFGRGSLLVEKKSKNGVTRQDIIPMLRCVTVTQSDAHTLTLRARVCCQNPSLNPMQLGAAIAEYLPEYTADFTKCSRIEIYDEKEQIFR